MNLPTHFYELMQYLEYSNPETPRIGTSLSPKREPYRFGMYPTLSQQTTEVVQPSSHWLNKRPTQKTALFLFNHFGLLGPNGALPLHLTEYAIEQIIHHNEFSWSDFLDVFHHRFYELFYRAWAESKPTSPHKKKAYNPFASHLLELLGSHAIESESNSAYEIDLQLAPFQLQHNRHAEGVEKALCHILGCSVNLQSFQGQWLPISSNTRSTMGLNRCQLGKTFILGKQVWNVQSLVNFEIGPLNWVQFEALQPGNPANQILFKAVNRLLGGEFDWLYTLVLKPGQAPKAEIKKTSRLGRCVWLGRKPEKLAMKVSYRGAMKAPLPSKLTLH